MTYTVLDATSGYVANVAYEVRKNHSKLFKPSNSITGIKLSGILMSVYWVCFCQFADCKIQGVRFN